MYQEATPWPVDAPGNQQLSLGILIRYINLARATTCTCHYRQWPK